MKKRSIITGIVCATLLFVAPTIVPAEELPSEGMTFTETVVIIPEPAAPAEAPEETPTEAPSAPAETPSEPASAPTEQVVETPVQPVVEAPLEQIVETPVQPVVEAPVEQVIETPAMPVVYAQPVGASVDAAPEADALDATVTPRYEPSYYTVSRNAMARQEQESVIEKAEEKEVEAPVVEEEVKKKGEVNLSGLLVLGAIAFLVILVMALRPYGVINTGSGKMKKFFRIKSAAEYVRDYQFKDQLQIEVLKLVNRLREEDEELVYACDRRKQEIFEKYFVMNKKEAEVIEEILGYSVKAHKTIVKSVAEIRKAAKAA